MEPRVRIYVTGRVGLSGSSGFVSDWTRAGQQGRILFCFLIAEHVRAVSQDELADELWPDALPSSWERSISALVSKLRSMVVRADLPPSCIESAFGCYQFRISSDIWIDLDAATSGIDEAECSLRRGDPDAAWGWAQVAQHIARRPFLAGADGPWARRIRSNLADVLVRAHDCLSEIYLLKGEPTMAAAHAEQSVAMEPYRETSYRHLMRAYRSSGNRALAHQAYQRCCNVLAAELGVSPSPETNAAHAEIVGIENLIDNLPRKQARIPPRVR